MERYEGRVALVTGASSGIGLAIATKLVGAGMKVVGCGRGLEKLQEVAGQLNGKHKGEFVPLRCDLSSETDVRSLIETINKDHGGVDVCVINAGILITSTIMDGDFADWVSQCNVNVLGSLLCSQLAVKSMQSKGADDGSIIFINSEFGTQVPDHHHGFHFNAVTKFALHAGKIALRQELKAAKSHIRVMEVSPGLVNTGETVERAMGGKEAAARVMKMFTPLRPEDVADTVAYMLTAPPLVELHQLSISSTEQPR